MKANRGFVAQVCDKVLSSAENKVSSHTDPSQNPNDSSELQFCQRPSAQMHEQSLFSKNIRYF